VSVLKKLPASFFATSTGKEPVREWLRDMAIADRKEIGIAIATAEYGWPIGMPLARSMGRGLFEIRVDLAGKRTARVLVAVAENDMILLHGFIKKSRKTPRADMELALKRLREFTGRS